jgi:hypothetical protein
MQSLEDILRPIKPTQIKPQKKVSRTFVGKYDILSKIKSPIFTVKYDKATLVSKTFIASYDIKVFDWATLQKLQNARTLLAAISAMQEMESIEDLSE